MKKQLLNPQQELFLKQYTDPKSGTFGNALQSALKAKYSREYAENIMSLMPDWLSENIGKLKMLKKAEKNLMEVQDISIRDDEGKLDAQLIDKRTKVDMFIAKTIGKSEYSERQEITGEGGSPLSLTFDAAFKQDEQ